MASSIEIPSPIVLLVPERVWFTLNEEEEVNTLLKTITMVTTPGVTLLGGSQSTYNDVYVNAPGAVTLTMPTGAFQGQEWMVKDISGLASANPITVASPSGAYPIDGYSSFLLNNNYASLSFVWNGTGLSVKT